MTMMKKIRQFGARVIGEQRVEEEKKVEEVKATRFGPKVLGTKVIAGTNTPAPDSKPVPKLKPVLLSIPSLRKMLDQNPAAARGLFVDEMGRSEGPRRGALEALRESAVKREADALVADIDIELAVLRGEPRPEPTTIEAPERLPVAEEVPLPDRPEE